MKMRSCSENNHRCNGKIFFLAAWATILIWVLPAVAGEKKVKQDTTDDGRVDQIVYFDPRGKIELVEIDSNNDGVMDRYQYYQQETLARVERDTDHDGNLDCQDYFKKGKRVRQKRLNPDGNVDQVIEFNDSEQPQMMKKDTTGSGTFDTFYDFTDGKLASVRRDSNENGVINVRTTYADDKPVKRTVDEDENGRPEQIIFYNAEGMPEKSRHDLTADGRLETTRFYESGQIARQEKDADDDGQADNVTFFKKGEAISQKKIPTWTGPLMCF
ncbi:MAG: hypothetical protein ACLFS7_07155 [Desulfosudaceae bacterium]